MSEALPSKYAELGTASEIEVCRLLAGAHADEMVGAPATEQLWTPSGQKMLMPVDQAPMWTFYMPFVKQIPKSVVEPAEPTAVAEAATV